MLLAAQWPVHASELSRVSAGLRAYGTDWPDADVASEDGSVWRLGIAVFDPEGRSDDDRVGFTAWRAPGMLLRRVCAPVASVTGGFRQECRLASLPGDLLSRVAIGWMSRHPWGDAFWGLSRRIDMPDADVGRMPHLSERVPADWALGATILGDWGPWQASLSGQRSLRLGNPVHPLWNSGFSLSYSPDETRTFGVDYLVSQSPLAGQPYTQRVALRAAFRFNKTWQLKLNAAQGWGDTEPRQNVSATIDYRFW
jgi:hypothetical protein